MRHPLPWFLLSDEARRCIHGTTIDCLGCRSSLLEYRFGRSGSSGFVGGFRLWHWCGCVLVPKVRSYRDRCRDRYTCRPVGLPARDGCRPKQIRFPLRGRLKLLRLSDGFCLSFCSGRRRCRPKSLSYRLF